MTGETAQLLPVLVCECLRARGCMCACARAKKQQLSHTRNAHMVPYEPIHTGVIAAYRVLFHGVLIGCELSPETRPHAAAIFVCYFRHIWPLCLLPSLQISSVIFQPVWNDHSLPPVVSRTRYHLTHMLSFNTAILTQVIEHEGHEAVFI